MKTLADIRRLMVPGTEVYVTNHIRPEASGPRVVEKNQTKDIAWKLPDGKITWLKWPKASEIEIVNPDSVTFFFVEGRPFVTIKFPQLTPPCAATLGCLCAGHARGASASKPCSSVE